MITERPLLTIRREFPRPEAKSAGRFAGAATVHLVDAIGGRGALAIRSRRSAAQPPRSRGRR